MVKFSFSLDGIVSSGVGVFTGQKNSAEDNALPEAILKQVKKKLHDHIYVIDRGLQSVRVVNQFDQNSAQFIIRPVQIDSYGLD
jgi:transposase